MAGRFRELKPAEQKKSDKYFLPAKQGSRSSCCRGGLYLSDDDPGMGLDFEVSDG